MFCVGQTVLYGSSGVCTIDDVTEKRIGKNRLQYYVLKPLCAESSTVFVPTANKTLVGKIKSVMTEEEAQNMLAALPDCGEWNENKQERSEAFRAVISGGSRVDLIRLIRLISFHGREQNAKGKRLHLSDERFLKEAEKMICEEFSLVLRLDRSEVLARLLK